MIPVRFEPTMLVFEISKTLQETILFTIKQDCYKEIRILLSLLLISTLFMLPLAYKDNLYSMKLFTNPTAPFYLTI
jgi:hypothetical protein